MRIEVRDEARDDIRSALLWYAAQRPGLELEFLDALGDDFDFLLRAPRGARRIKGTIRQIPMARFPYQLIHSGEKDVIVILRVFHNRRDPRTMLRQRRAK